MEAVAIAHSNIALIKYWGKRNSYLNIPAVGSISVTLKELYTRTKIRFDSAFDKDQLVINGQTASLPETERISRFLHLIRRQARLKLAARVESENNFPTAAGLASSASAFAALALGASHAAGLSLGSKELSILARRGSGSAARSIFGGIVEMHRGRSNHGRDAFAEPVADRHYWDLRVLIAITSQVRKKTASTEGMTQSKRTSPYYRAWIRTSEQDLRDMREAIQNKDFEKLGELTEYSCLKMHALAMASNPGLIYWNGTTVDGIQLIRELRQKGHAVYFTIDAGPQVKAICLPQDAAAVSEALQSLPGVQKVIHSALGDDARIIEESR